MHSGVRAFFNANTETIEKNLCFEFEGPSAANQSRYVSEKQKYFFFVFCHLFFVLLVIG